MRGVCPQRQRLPLPFLKVYCDFGLKFLPIRECLFAKLIPEVL